MIESTKNPCAVCGVTSDTMSMGERERGIEICRHPIAGQSIVCLGHLDICTVCEAALGRYFGKPYFDEVTGALDNIRNTITSYLARLPS